MVSVVYLQEQVVVTHVEGPCAFYGQLNNTEEGAQISDKLRAMCPTSKPCTGQPVVGKVRQFIQKEPQFFIDTFELK